MSRPDGGRVRDDALHLLAGQGCALCAAASDGEQAWVRGFVNEARTDLDAMDAVRDGLGFCPAHLRRVLADPAASWVLPPVAAEVVDEGRRRLGGVLAGRRADRVAACVGCVGTDRSVRSAAGVLAATLLDGGVQEAFRASGGLCAPHVLDLAEDAASGRDRAAVRQVVVEVLLSSVVPASTDGTDSADDMDRADAERGTAAAATAVTGQDPDADRRAAFGPALAVLAAQDDEAAAEGGGSALARLWLDRATCPLCTAATVTARRYLTWLTGSGETPGRGDPPSGQDLVLCATHLADAARIGGPGLPRVVDAALARAREDVADVVTGRPAVRRRGVRTVPDGAAPRLGCRACDAAGTAHRRAWDLLDAACADRTLAERARGAHGLCLRDGLDHAAGHGPAGRLLGEVLDGRLAMLGWDLAEGIRLGRWDVRFATVGAQSTAWRRGTSLLDGRVDLGTPTGV